MEQIREAVEAFGFASPVVEVISGSAEGRLAWTAINHVLGSLENAQKPSVGLIEIGGASVQVTFALVDDIYSHTHDQLGEKISWEKYGAHCKDLPLDYSVCRASLHLQMNIAKPDGLRGDVFYLVEDFQQLKFLLNLSRASSQILDSRGQDTCDKTSDVLKREMPHGDMKYLPRVCFQVAFISVALEKIGFKFDQELVIAKSQPGMAISWPLGSLLERMRSVKSSGDHCA